MKRLFSFLAFVGTLTTIGAQAQISENFNTRSGAAATSQVKGYLQGRCWIFDAFDVNQGWTPALEGDGGMVSGATATNNQKDGIYSPLVDVPGEVTVTFSYKIDNAITGGAHRWIKFYLTDADKNVAGGWMDSLDITNKAANTVHTFNKKFWPVGSGSYRVFINYQGTGGNTRFAIDQLTISAPLYYPGGCNSAPVAVNDNLNGAANHSAAGMVTSNDTDPNHENFYAYLVTNSPDGNVVLNTDGSFNFTPNPGFAGSFTTFKYKICDWGFTPLCSNDATVTLLFAPASTLPVSLVDFKGLYNDDGNVELSWVTNFEQNSDRFDVERSLDGEKWDVVGTVKGQGTSGVRKSYVFMDKVSRNVANKKDLYYRLRQVDLDSKATITKMLIVRVYNTHSLKMVSVSPNPAKNDISVNVQLNEASFIVMRILNSNGAETMRKSVKAGAGSNSYLMDNSSNLKPGMYVLEVTINSKERMIVKLIKE